MVIVNVLLFTFQSSVSSITFRIVSWSEFSLFSFVFLMFNFLHFLILLIFAPPTFFFRKVVL